MNILYGTVQLTGNLTSDVPEWYPTPFMCHFISRRYLKEHALSLKKRECTVVCSQNSIKI